MGDADPPSKDNDVKKEETNETRKETRGKAPLSAASSTTAPSERSQPAPSAEKKEETKQEEEEEGPPGLSTTPSKESAEMDVDDDASKTEVKKVAPVEKAPEPVKEPAPPAAAAATDEDDAVEY